MINFWIIRDYISCFPGLTLVIYVKTFKYDAKPEAERDAAILNFLGGVCHGTRICQEQV